ncbi:unnamed protein product [Ambrosiozyma monospora]|uniref:Unnamed protein product n=1 Tax=Ambrosiozyma monospora TaxID=43982 RepID=A0ACB5UAL3_AMBMO|nr:unnamed protein product [Ambrosiozyma monospora]
MLSANVEVFYGKHIYGIRFGLEDGDDFLIGRDDKGEASFFAFEEPDHLIGVTLSYENRVNAIQFRTASDEFTEVYGTDEGSLIDITFNSNMSQVSGYESSRGLESIRFHW